MTDYQREQLEKIGRFLRSICTPNCKTLSYTDSSIALISAKYIEEEILKEKEDGQTEVGS